MNIITTKEHLDELVAHYLKQDAFAYDVETVGERRGVTVVNTVSWISLATHGRADVIPLGHPNGEYLETIYPLTGQGETRRAQGLKIRKADLSRSEKRATVIYGPAPEQLFPNEVFTSLKPLMFNKDITIVGHNLVFDLTSVAKYYKGQIPEGKNYFDTMVASFIYDNRNKNKCGLDDCLNREFGYHMVKGVGKEVEKHSFKEVAKYAYLDAKYTWVLYKKLIKKLKEVDVTFVMKLEMDVLRVLCDMKLNGASIDQKELQKLNDQLEVDIEKARDRIYSTAGRVFNINSNPEKQQILYSPVAQGGRGIKPTVLTEKGEGKRKSKVELFISDYSVSADALEIYKEDELVSALLDYSELNKILTTYVVPYLGGVSVRSTNGKTKSEEKESLLVNGKLHCDFVQIGAETGRFSSRNPNLQNVPAPEDPNKVPADKQYGRMIRNLFYAPEGYKLVVADYSQIEPRIIADMSGDPIMIKNYVEGGDIYTTVGNEMGVDRKAGKVLVLAIAYGVGPDKIANQIGCSLQEAKDLLNRFSERFSSIESYKAKVIGVAKNYQYVQTLMGRKRFIPEISSKNYAFRSSAERQAFNTRIQGSAADIIKFAMVRAYDLIPKESKMLLTVHDEIVTMAPDRLADTTAEAIREAMEGIKLSTVPLIADVKIVQRWGEAK